MHGSILIYHRCISMAEGRSYTRKNLMEEATFYYSVATTMLACVIKRYKLVSGFLGANGQAKLHYHEIPSSSIALSLPKTATTLLLKHRHKNPNLPLSTPSARSARPFLSFP